MMSAYSAVSHGHSHPELVKVLIEQAKKFKPNTVVITNEDKYKEVDAALFDLGIKVFAGAQSLEEVVEGENIDIVLTALVGYSGLKPTIRAIKAKKNIALANKETLVVAGGVSANISLRSTLSAMAKKLDVDVFYPAHEFCTDNGAMIALAGHFRFLSGQRNDHYEISIKPRWSLEELQSV